MTDPDLPCTSVNMVVRPTDGSLGDGGAAPPVSTTTTTPHSTTTTASRTSTTPTTTASTLSTTTRATTSTTPTSAVATTTTSAAPGSPLNPNEPATVAGTWNYIGCYQDLVNGARSLTGSSSAFDPMTLEACAAKCVGFDYFGTEFGREVRTPVSPAILCTFHHGKLTWKLVLLRLHLYVSSHVALRPPFALLTDRA